MRPLTVTRPIATVAAALALLAPANPSQANGVQAAHQPPDATAQASRIAELETQLRKLAEELTAAKARVAELEAALQEERARAAAAIAAAQASQGYGQLVPSVADRAVPRDVTEQNATASYAHFIEYARSKYATDFGPKSEEELARGEKETPPLPKRLEQWAARMTREWRKPLRWIVRPGVSDWRGDGLVVRCVVLDEATGEELGNDFDLYLEPRIAKRYVDRFTKVAPPERFTVVGVFAPRFFATPERQEMGPFDNPPFIGPGIELIPNVSVTSFSPTKEEKQKAPADAGSPAPAPPSGAPAGH